ncbi:hypothetical protein [Sodalis glossinidius]|uniref:hypothetical protein n=1 Tax=Sodalis glossinidius TaxID=63612 RepID=UPI001FB06442|nr:hypothetical protein [Sodalis glossinidius]
MSRLSRGSEAYQRRPPGDGTRPFRRKGGDPCRDRRPGATLDDLDVLRQAAGAADAVIHTAFNHDFYRFIESCEQDRQVIETLGSALAGNDRPLLVTTGVSGLPRGATEYDRASPSAH